MRIIRMGYRTAFLFSIDHDLSAFEAFLDKKKLRLVVVF